MPRRPGARRCGHVGEDGKSCGAWALRDSPEETPRCAIHSLDAEGRKQRAQRAAAVSAARRRADVEPAHRAGLVDPSLTFEDVLGIVAPALAATLETREPDWSARLAGCAVVLLAFPRQMRSTPEQARELIERCLPAAVLEQKGMRERLDCERALAALRAEWRQLDGLRWSELRGLVVGPYPRDLVPPWLDYAAVCQRELPRDVPPERAPVIRLPNGRHALKRPGELPLLLEDVS